MRVPGGDDARATGRFYEAVFGWTVRDEDADERRAAFADATGHVIGHLLAERPVAGDAGIRPYVYVSSVVDAVARIVAHGGVIREPPFAEGNLTVAVFADPAGNVLGVWQFGAPD